MAASSTTISYGLEVKGISKGAVVLARRVDCCAALPPRNQAIALKTPGRG